MPVVVSVSILGSKDPVFKPSIRVIAQPDSFVCTRVCVCGGGGGGGGGAVISKSCKYR